MNPLAALARFAPLVRAGLIAGVVIAGLAYPLAALAGIGARKGSDALAAMPTQLTVSPQAQTTYVYASDGRTLITMFYEEYRQQTALAAMSPTATAATLLAPWHRAARVNAKRLRRRR